MSRSSTRTSRLGSRRGAGHSAASSASDETPSTSSRRARPDSVERTGTRRRARDEIPRAASLPASPRQAEAASGATTATEREPACARARTSSAIAASSAEGPAGRTTRTAPDAGSGLSVWTKSDDARAESSAGRPGSSQPCSSVTSRGAPSPLARSISSRTASRPGSDAGASSARRTTVTSRSSERRARSLS